MFTGIVQGLATIVEVATKPNLVSLKVELPATASKGIEIGASIALNGTCLTVTAQTDNLVQFDMMLATLELTNLKGLQPGDKINFERAARIGDEIGGHLMSGHIHGTTQIVAIEHPDNNCIIWFSKPPKLAKYILPKGYIGLNGASLTLHTVTPDQFCVYLIPETLRATTFGTAQIGDTINIEIDPQTQTIVDTVETVLQNRVG